jgi:hypothetical protein
LILLFICIISRKMNDEFMTESTNIKVIRSQMQRLLKDSSWQRRRRRFERVEMCTIYLSERVKMKSWLNKRALFVIYMQVISLDKSRLIGKSFIFHQSLNGIMILFFNFLFFFLFLQHHLTFFLLCCCCFSVCSFTSLYKNIF